MNTFYYGSVKWKHTHTYMHIPSVSMIFLSYFLNSKFVKKIIVEKLYFGKDTECSYYNIAMPRRP